MRLHEARRDLYRRLAREQGYVSRAAFKLLQLQRQYRFLRPGQIVVDFGCAPGGWLQVAASHVGSRGLVIGVDRQTPRVRPSNTRVIVADIGDPAVSPMLRAHLPRPADVVLSDLAPIVIGVWELDHHRQMDLTRQVLALLPEIAARGALAVLKLFDGPELQELVRALRHRFAQVDVTKPPASRGPASELYAVCRGYRGD
jgi:23S rRNA (uridine2552-2'-O)-methyltransferase